MKDGRTTKSESNFGGKLWWCLIATFLGVVGWQVWKLNAYNNAVRQAKEAGFEWICHDAISYIRQDWRNSLKKETWGEHPSMLDMRGAPNLGCYREMLHHLNPTDLRAWGCEDENVDGLKGLTALKELYLRGCPGIPAAALRELAAALPNATIRFPDGTLTPPP